MQLTVDWNTLDNKAKKRLAAQFQRALQQMADYWNENKDNVDSINDHLVNDLQKFPRMITEIMQAHDSEVE
jgi:hypothetical protein